MTRLFAITTAVLTGIIGVLIGLLLTIERAAHQEMGCRLSWLPDSLRLTRPWPIAPIASAGFSSSWIYSSHYLNQLHHLPHVFFTLYVGAVGSTTVVAAIGNDKIHRPAAVNPTISSSIGSWLSMALRALPNKRSDTTWAR